MPGWSAPSATLVFRPACASDTLSLSVLAMQVYLDTYAVHGIRDAIARDVLRSFPEQAFAAAIADAQTRLWVAERDAHLIGCQTHYLIESERHENRVYAKPLA